jgi:hypothetical protein
LCGIDPGLPDISNQDVVTLEINITSVTFVKPWPLLCLAAMKLIHETDDNGKSCEISRLVFSDERSVTCPRFYVKPLRITFKAIALLRELNS